MKNKINNFCIVISISSLLFLMSCSKPLPLTQNTSFENKLREKIKYNREVGIGSIYFAEVDSLGWDTILICRSYLQADQLEGLNIKNLKSVKKAIEPLETTDFYNIVIFLKNDVAISYAKINAGLGIQFPDNKKGFIYIDKQKTRFSLISSSMSTINKR